MLEAFGYFLFFFGGLVLGMVSIQRINQGKMTTYFSKYLDVWFVLSFLLMLVLMLLGWAFIQKATHQNAPFLVPIITTIVGVYAGSYVLQKALLKFKFHGDSVKMVCCYAKRAADRIEAKIMKKVGSENQAVLSEAKNALQKILEKRSEAMLKRDVKSFKPYITEALAASLQQVFESGKSVYADSKITLDSTTVVGCNISMPKVVVYFQYQTQQVQVGADKKTTKPEAQVTGHRIWALVKDGKNWKLEHQFTMLKQQRRLAALFGQLYQRSSFN